MTSFRFLFAILVCVGCERPSPKVIRAAGTPATGQAESIPALPAVLISNSPILGKPGVITLTDSVLWVSDYGGDPFLHLINANSGRIIWSKGAVGDGPGDFRSVMAVMPSPDGTSAIVFDATGRRLTKVNRNPKIPSNIGDVKRLPLPMVFRLARLREGYIGWSPDSITHLIIFDSSGAVRTRESGYLLGGDSVPHRQRVSASNNVSICARPRGDRLIVAYLYAGRIEIRDRDAKFLRLADVPDSSDGEFKVSSKGELGWSPTKYFYPSCFAADSFFVAVYSGSANRAADKSPLPADGTQLQIYDWNGNLKAKFITTEPLRSITIGKDGRTIFGTNSVNSSIYRLQLPSDLKLEAMSK